VHLARLLAAVSLAAPLIGQTSPGYRIAGTVVDHRTKAALASVLVTIRAANSRAAEPAETLTDTSGHFQFFNLSAGKYTLSAQRRGGHPHQFEQRGQFLTAIVTGPGLDSEHIIFALPAESRISGFVRDDDGDPVSGATVHLLHRQVFDGKQSVQLQGQSMTTASGAFHFPHLAAGTYYLAAAARPWYAQRPAYFTESFGQLTKTGTSIPAPGLDMAFPMTYSGDVTDPNAAQAIVLPEGSNVTSQIVLHAVPAQHLSLPEPDMQQQSGNRPRLMPGIGVNVVGPGGVILSSPAETPQRPAPDEGGTPEQEIYGLAPGTYRMQQYTFKMGGNAHPGSELLVTVGSGGASVSKASVTRIQGKVSYEGAAPTKGSEENLGLQFAGDTARSFAFVEESGTFTVQNALPPGQYRISIVNGTGGLAVRSVNQHPGSTITISDSAPEALELNLTLGPASTSSLSGFAINEGTPVPGAMVLLLSNDDGTGWIGRDQSDSDGSFTIPNVEAGRYKLLAIDQAESGGDELEYRNPAVLKKYLGAAQAVDVPLPARQALSVQVVPRGAN